MEGNSNHQAKRPHCSICSRELAVDGSETIYRDDADRLYCESCAGDEIVMLTIVADLSGLLDF